MPFDPMQKARKAFDNAKYRSGRSPGYESTKFSLPPFKDFIAIIGLPKENESLDRIDPHGDYEIGNVRWTSTAVQAANKKSSSGGSTIPLSVAVESARAGARSAADRQMTADLWRALVLHFSCVDRQPGIADHPRLKHLNLEASFGYGDRLWPELPVGVFEMVALTEPDAKVRIRGGPFAINSTDPRRQAWRTAMARSSGIIQTLQREDYRLNILPQEAAWLIEDLDDTKRNGSCWIGRPTPAALLGGWFEGKMLSAASRLRDFNKNAAMLPALQALEQWQAWNDPENYRELPAVAASFLFVPDFQVDAGPDWRSTNDELYSLAKLVERRANDGLKTFVGIQRHASLPPKVRDLLFSRLNVREFDANVQTPHPDPDEVRKAFRRAFPKASPFLISDLIQGQIIDDP